MPSAKRKANIIATMILGAAAGLRPSALIAANPTAAMIKDGPMVLMNITKAIVKFFMRAAGLNVILFLVSFDQNNEFIVHHAGDPLADKNRLQIALFFPGFFVPGRLSQFF